MDKKNHYIYIYIYIYEVTCKSYCTKFKIKKKTLNTLLLSLYELFTPNTTQLGSFFDDVCF